MNEPVQQYPDPAQTGPRPPAAAPQYPPPPQPATGAQVDPRRKSPLFACILSFLMPGLGQVYVGYYQRGFVHVAVFAVLLTLLVAEALGPLIPAASVFLAFFVLYNIVDAGRRAVLYNQVLAGGADIPLPEDFKMPGIGGSIAGGISLVAIGGVMLAHTRFGMSLDWIADWWPAALILFGAYLVFKAAQERTARQAETGDGRDEGV